MPEVVLLRHAETEWSVARKHTGRSDIPLTAAGREAAAAARPRFAERRFALALSSPLSRARDTAELVGVETEPEPGLLEWDYGEYEGITTKTIRETRPEWSLWTDGCPGGETPEAVAGRADGVIERALAATTEGDVLLVAHGHLLRVLTARWLEQPVAFGERLVLPTLGEAVLGWERETRALMRWACA